LIKPKIINSFTCKVLYKTFEVFKFVKYKNMSLSIVFKNKIIKIIKKYKNKSFKLSNDIILGEINYNHSCLKMYIGKIWQETIGCLKGWKSNETGIDLINKSKKIAIELKNSYNTCNSSSKKAIIQKLKEFKLNNSEYTVIYAYINCNSKNNEGIKYYKDDILHLSGIKFLKYIFDDKYLNVIKLLKSNVKTELQTVSIN
jgi:hypothetical protein